ncbi:MAG: ankyrin repeat domain-containing protein [Verrucomicrobium sp.]|nr:ankyrin repeat domain-containing protein [Verrucomicrobium sp.]
MGDSDPKPLMRASWESRGWLIDAMRQGTFPAVAALYRIPLACFLEGGQGNATPLHTAAFTGYLPQVAACVGEVGESLSLADLSRPTLGGWTPLHEAAHGGRFRDVIRVLREAGEEPGLDALLVPDGFSARTPLHVAAQRRQIAALAAAVREAGWELRPRHWLAANRDGKTALDEAALHGNLDQVFEPSLWTRRVGEMGKLWSYVREESRGGVDFERLSHEAALASRAPRVPAAAFRGAARPELSGPGRAEKGGPLREN